MGLVSATDNNVVSFDCCDNGRFLVGGDYDMSESFYISFTWSLNVTMKHGI